VSRIRVLPDDLVNRIAAGEVVERPASVVKELVENALDAGAGRVEVELEAGGRRLVRVADDGCGMSEDEALLALERHATSKIASAEDLERIETLGFRGEALPSIAAVSRFELLTAADPGRGGVRVTVEGGRVTGVEAAARPRGTTVTVRDLFFNTPARRKFLAAVETELRHAVTVVTEAALARPAIGFRLRHAGRTLVEAPPAPDRARRLADLGRGRLGRVREFEASSGAGVVRGLVAPGTGGGRPRLAVLVNGRPVRDRLLVSAVRRVLRASGERLAGGWRVVEVVVPPGSVDVNVHPAKAEVRFGRAGAVFALVETAVRRGLAALHGTVAVRRVRAPSGYPSAPRPGRVAEPRTAHLFPETPPPPPPPAAEASGARPAPADTPLGRVIGQYRDSFILLDAPEGLLIVDQHVAHERVLYERFLERLRAGRPVAQRLLEPVLVEVEPELAAAVPRVAVLAARAGLELDTFGGDTVRVSAVPPELEAAEAAALVRELLERAVGEGEVAEGVVEERLHELAAALACRAAVKINHPLALEAQRGLVRDLAATSDPYRCPHGRPVVLTLDQDEMERRFGRR